MPRYTSLRDCVEDLKQRGDLLIISDEVDPYLEMAEIHRQVHQDQGPAILFERVKGSPFQAVSNVYGTWNRTKYLFESQLPTIKALSQIKTKPEAMLKRPWQLPSMGLKAMLALPKKVRSPKVMMHETTISELPQVVSWPDDGGGFVTLPQVCSLPPGISSIMQSNIGMYRIQMTGNDYQMNEEVGLHYQLHRGIGVHHRSYLDSEAPFKVSIFVGGPPSHAVAAIMPLPEGMSEVTFMGLLGGRRFRYAMQDGYVLSADADFVITGEVDKEILKPEGPFGDHLGYYSLEHLFPYMRVHKVWHRPDPLWHFTVVGRPPQEDSNFGQLIHHVVEDVTPHEFPGLKSINAVDEAGVHPLLLAIGSERYMPWRTSRPEEVLTIANHLLGKGQTSLAKYLIITDAAEDPDLDTHDYPGYFRYVLERLDLSRDLHFYTQWTVDTLDYSGHDWNAGSKIVMAATGSPIRTLADEIPPNWPASMPKARIVMPGVLAVQWTWSDQQHEEAITRWAEAVDALQIDGYPLIVLCDDSNFVAEEMSNFLWVTFTRSDPARDLHGSAPSTESKHWRPGRHLIIDATTKSHHAPPLIVDTAVESRVKDRLSKIDHAR